MSSFHDIFGEMPAESISIPPCPGIDEARDTKRLARNPLHQEHAIKAIFGDEFLAMMKAENPSPAIEPATSTYRGQPSLTAPVPERINDPRKPVCACGCQFCRTQDCINCDGDEPCSQSHGGYEVAILDVGDQIREEFASALRTEVRRQIARPAKKVNRSREAEFLEKHYGYDALVGRFHR
ncbi:MAG TPA: hypothetical protein VKR59_13125 [Terriglobales bacterium]|nr:hypothetical protein [Terriglobales bacterium]